MTGDTNVLESGTSTQALLRINVRWVRLLVVTATAAVAMAIALLLCDGAGIHLGTVSGDRNNADQKSLLDTYNSVSGGIVSAVLAPIEIVLSMLAAVTRFTFLSKLTLKRGLHSHLVTAALRVVVSFLVTNGPSTLNVQLVPGDVVALIISTDLSLTENVVDSQSAPAANGTLLTTWNKSFGESRVGNPALNTIFRTHLLDRNDKLDITHRSSITTSQLGFGFAPRAWHLDTLTTARDPNRSIEFKLDNKSMDALPSDDELPMSTANASYLVLAATQAVPWLMGIDGESFLWNTSLGVDIFKSALETKETCCAECLDQSDPSTTIITYDPLVFDQCSAAKGICCYGCSFSYGALNYEDGITFDDNETAQASAGQQFSFNFNNVARVTYEFLNVNQAQTSFVSNRTEEASYNKEEDVFMICVDDPGKVIFRGWGTDACTQVTIENTITIVEGNTTSSCASSSKASVTPNKPQNSTSRDNTSSTVADDYTNCNPTRGTVTTREDGSKYCTCTGDWRNPPTCDEFSYVKTVITILGAVATVISILLSVRAYVKNRQEKKTRNQSALNEGNDDDNAAFAVQVIHAGGEALLVSLNQTTM
ncbi:hypothetical protein BBJ29_009505 [Phytophthora kernoviae]|uniref:Uncharacterized protein n=1 Tax=Phytophthora kernoviae TaxID=325452 RepID=A0A3F2RDU1_9STRA|nr:hypothetical protein BBJ29_009505 [Phytophthora kernoviae]RLN52227.1 hypothetical protein BBP00_00009694 [Phytophthora kernoviae]